MTKSDNKLIVVLGMHRSGTSVITRGLQVMGVDLGNRLMPPLEGNNEKGFWEDLDINSLNIEMLNSLNIDWHFLTPIQASDVNALRRDGYVRRAVQLLREKVSGSQIFGFKDPRVTKLLPFWKEVFAQSGLNVSYIITIRHPLSVSKSLARRDDFEAEKSHLLWLEHVLSSLIGTIGENRVLINYDHLLQSPDEELIRVAKELQLQIDLSELEKFKTEFLDKKLQHTFYQLNDLIFDEVVPALVRELYAELLNVTVDRAQLESATFQEKFEQWCNEFSRQKSALILVDKLTLEVNSINQTLAGKDLALVEKEKALVEKEKALVEIEQAFVEIKKASAEKEKASAEKEDMLLSHIAEKEQVIQAFSTRIMEREHDLSEIRNSRAWKVALLFRRIRVMVAPPNSFRARGLRFLFNIAVFPFRTIPQYWQKASYLIRTLANILSHPGDIISLSKKALNIWRRDGWAGVKSSIRFYTNYSIETNAGNRKSGVNSLSHHSRSDKKEIFLDMHDLPETYTPKVSVIVPNFNHSAYLEERLTSIYEQTYKNFEVILLDDCSTDNSVSILKKYAVEYSEKTRSYFNEVNSGSPFSQWEKGILLADGDLIWIAESDDFCEKTFLEKLVPIFFNDSILLSYAHPFFIDGDGKQFDFAFEHYVGQIDPKKWSDSYIETAHNEVNTALGLLNTIPNVSGVLFRKIDRDFFLFSDPEWKKMQVCGDWLFYLHLIRGGSIAYRHDAHNYYRMYASSTSKKTHSRDIYYQEHERVAIAIASLYKIQDNLLLRLQARLKNFYFKNVEDGSTEKFDALFDINKIIRSMQARQPNVLMATYGLVAGGGEIFPVRLANALQKAGAAVTLFNGCYEPTQTGVRKMLSPQIAVVTNSSALRVNEMLANFGIDIIHSHHASMENYFAVTRFIGTTGVKHIATLHGMYEMMNDFNFIHSTKDIQKSVDYWVYTADKNILPFKKNGLFTADKFIKMDNGLPIQGFNKVDLSPLGITSESFIACLASRAIPEKGWIEAIEATQKTREITGADVHLLLIGDGPIYDMLSAKELPAFIHLLGFKANVGDYLVSAQLGLLPSYFKGESFPFVMIEFFIAGIPVIATNIGETSRMIRTEDHKMAGVLLELHNGKVNSNELARAMIKMVTDKEFYNKCVNTVSLLKPRFDIDNIAQQYLEVYKRNLS